MSARSKIRELRRVVDREPIRSLTVDVFDTLVFRDYSSEEERFLKVAERWQPLLQNHISSTIDAEEVYSFRRYARDLAYRTFRWRRSIGLIPSPEAEFEIGLTPWVADVIDQLAAKYAVALTTQARDSLVAELVAIELEFEAEHLRPNTELIAVINDLAVEYQLRVYLVSDMYLSGVQLAQILMTMGVPTFDGVVTSSDVGFSKKTGRLFDHIETAHVFASYLNASNIHLGDRRQNDFDAPQMSGSRAILIRSGHHQLQRIGYRLSRRATQARIDAHVREQASRWSKRREALDPISARGALFGPSALQYVNTFMNRARTNPGVPFVAVSSEASYFEEATTYISLTQPKNLHYFAKVNRASLLRSIEQLAGDRGTKARVVDAPFLDEVRLQIDPTAAKGKMSPPKSQWPFGTSVSKTNAHMTLLDVGWMGTIQVMAQELAALEGRKTEVSGLYLGRFAVANRFGFSTGVREGVVFQDVKSRRERPYFVPELWEYILGNKAEYLDFGPHEKLQAGTSWAFTDWCANVRLSPADFVRLSNPSLKRMLWKPSKADRAILGSILWDVKGENALELRSLIPTTGRSTFSRYLRLITHPRDSYREYVTPLPHIWVAGYAREGKLSWFMHFALFVAKRIGHLDNRKY